MTVIEVCVESPDGVRAARDGGADRVELCRDLRWGGLTPTFPMIEASLGYAPLEGLRILVRENKDTFDLSQAEVIEQGKIIKSIIDEFHASRVPLGFVVGGVSGDALNVDDARRWKDAAEDYDLVFHRGFDQITDWENALETLADLGYTSVLTSGSKTGKADVARLKKMVDLARSLGNISIIGSGGLRADNIDRVIADTGLEEVHFRAPVEGSEETDAELVRRIVEKVLALGR